jgi:hypothetical protein
MFMDKTMSTGLISETENTRLDQLTAYNSMILNSIHGDELDQVLNSLIRRRGMSDVEYRKQALCNVHPDDLVTALVHNGKSLASLGIESISLG